MFKNLRPKMLNKRAEKSNWCQIISKLGISNGNVIANIGSGGGFFALKFSNVVGTDEKVYAIDNDKSKLEFIKKYNLNNIETIHTPDNTIQLKSSSVDMFFGRNSFHHIPNPIQYFKKLNPFLKLKGRIVIIDYIKTDKINFINLFGHSSKEDYIISSMKDAGYRHLTYHNLSKNESFNIFEI